MGYTSKQARGEVVNMNNQDNKAKRKTYAETYMSKIGEGFIPIFLDETNFNLYCRRSNGRTKTGTRAIIKVPSTKGKNYTALEQYLLMN